MQTDLNFKPEVEKMKGKKTLAAVLLASIVLTTVVYAGFLIRYQIIKPTSLNISSSNYAFELYQSDTVSNSITFPNLSDDLQSSSTTNSSVYHLKLKGGLSSGYAVICWEPINLPPNLTMVAYYSELSSPTWYQWTTSVESGNPTLEPNRNTVEVKFGLSHNGLGLGSYLWDVQFSAYEETS